MMLSEQKPPDIDQELRDLLCELEYRKWVNPISFYEHLPLQRKFHDDPSRIKGIFGGNRAGKTEEGAEYVISRCLERPKQRWWAAAESFPDSVNIQQRKVWELVPKNRLKYGRYDEINGFTNRKLLFDNGSIILFKSYDQGRESFASDDIDGIWNDEEPPYDIYKEERMRLMDRNGEMIFTMTSLKGITELIQDLFEDHDVLESQFAPLVNKELPRIIHKNSMNFYMLWTPENPYIDQSRVSEEVKFMPTDELMARIYGLPINLSGKIYMAFNKKIHVMPFEDLPDLKDCTLYFILDPHDRKPWAMCWIAVHKTRTCYVIDEYPNRNFNEMLFDDKTYDDYAKLIREKEDALVGCGCNRVYKRILDPNFGNKTMQLAERQGGQSKTTPKEELKRRGFRFIDGIDAIEAGHLKVREYIHYEKKDNEIIVQPKMFWADNCENSIRHHSRYSRKDIMAGDGDVKNKVAPQEKYKDFCFDSETEILTETGWKKFYELKDDLVATVNKNTFYIEFQRPTRFINYPYTGKMVYINSRCVNMMVTPNHKMVIGTQLSGYKGRNDRRIEFKQASELTPQMVIPIACNGTTRKDTDEYHKIWAAFIGIYLAEGSATGTKGGKIQIPGRGYSVYIAQSKNSRHLESIRQLLNKLPYKFTYNGKAFVCSDKDLWEDVYPLGNSYQKYIPLPIFNYGRGAQLELWKYLLMGDGWKRANGIDSYCTVSKRLFDDIQAILTMLGIPTGVTVRSGDNRKADGIVIKKQPKNGFATQYWISSKKNKFAGLCQSGQKKQAKKYSNVDYSGEVYCVTVPNGTVIVRRNNRVSISGNCDLTRYFCMANPKHSDNCDLPEHAPEAEKVY